MNETICLHYWLSQAYHDAFKQARTENTENAACLRIADPELNPFAHEGDCYFIHIAMPNGGPVYNFDICLECGQIKPIKEK